jgi:hypothetical protein
VVKKNTGRLSSVAVFHAFRNEAAPANSESAEQWGEGAEVVGRCGLATACPKLRIRKEEWSDE